MAIITVHIKGLFRGKYSGPLDKISSSNKFFYSINYYEKSVENMEVISPYHRRYLAENPFVEYDSLPNVLLQLDGQKDAVYFQEDLSNVLINEIKLSSITKDGDKTYGNISGVIYGTYTYDDTPIKVIDPINKPLIRQHPLTNILNGFTALQNRTTFPQFENQFGKWKDPIDKNTIVLGNNLSDWELRFLKVKKAFPTILIFLVLAGLAIFFFGFNFISIGLLGYAGILLLKNVIAPIAGWNNIPADQQPSMVGKGRRSLRSLYTLLLVIFLVLAFFLQWKLFFWILLVLFIFQLLTYSTVGLFQTRRIWQGLGALVLLACGLALFTFIYNYIPTKQDQNRERNDDEEAAAPRVDSVDGKIAFAYARTWKDYDDNVYRGEFKSLKNNFSNSRINRLNIQNPNGFAEIYNRVWVNDSTLMPSLYKMLDSIKVNKQLNAKQFADMAVSFVQYIPYVLVHEQSCGQLVSAMPNNQFIQTYHRSGKECLPDIKFGVQAPAEFGYNLKGDCDTRSILLFTILDHFGYDVAMLVSEAYGHCILGINMPGAGAFKTLLGKRYYAWETTAKGFKLGQLPAEVNNMNNWEIVLTSKN